MGYAENKKLAKDINNNTDSCVRLTKDTLELLKTKTKQMCELVLAISPKYLRRYVGSDNAILVLSNTSTVLPGSSDTWHECGFVPEHDGVVRVLLRYHSNRTDIKKIKIRVSVYRNESKDTLLDTFQFNIGSYNNTTHNHSFDIEVEKGTWCEIGICNNTGNDIMIYNVSIGANIVMG